MPKQTPIDEGYILLFGAIIRQSVTDYEQIGVKIKSLLSDVRDARKRDSSLRQLYDYYSAKTFLFDDNYLLSWLEDFGYEDMEITMIRQMVLKGRKTVKDVPNEATSYNVKYDVDAFLKDIGSIYTHQTYPVIFVLQKDDEVLKIWGIHNKNIAEAQSEDQVLLDWDSATEVEEIYDAESI